MSGLAIVGEAGARLKLGRHRAGTQRGHADAARTQLPMQRCAERHHIGFGRIVDRHVGPRQERRDRRDIENAAPPSLQCIHEGEREVGERAHVHVDHRELLGPAQRRGRPQQAEAGVVDHGLRLDPEAFHRPGDLCGGVMPLQVDGQIIRTAMSQRGDRVRQFHQPLLAARDQQELVAVARKRAGQGRADAGRGAGDQRHRAPVSHDLNRSRRPPPPAGATQCAPRQAHAASRRRARSGCPRTR